KLVILSDFRDVFDERRRIAGEFHTFSVEWMGHECALVHVDEVTWRRIGDASYGTKEDLSFLRIERANPNVMVLSGLCVTQKDEVAAVRQEVRPAMRLFLLIDFGREFRSSALRGDAMKSFRSTKENHAITTPCSTTILSNITENLWTPARRLNPEQFSVGEVSDGATVRGPKWSARAFSATEWLGLIRVERAHPELALAFGVARSKCYE